MKSRLITTEKQRSAAMAALLRLDFPYTLSVSHDKPRSEAANARYWATLDEHLFQINDALQRLSDHTGHTPMELKQIISADITPQQAQILWALEKNGVHKALKEACHIPTSKKLGTKAFHKFDTIMEATLSEVLGEVRAFERLI